MPRISRARAAVASAAAPTTIVADDYVEQPAEGAIIQSEEGRFDPIASKTISFFDSVRKIAPADWDRYLIYIYRVDPPVKNNFGEPSYISKHAQPIDEDTVREEHGGGKYKIILKDVRRDSSRTHLLRVEGQPKFLVGQTLVQPESQPAQSAPLQQPTPTANNSDIAEIIRAIREVIREPSGGTSQIEIMTQATKSALDVVTTAAKESAKSSTGSAMLDEITKTVILKAIDRPAAAADPLKEKLIDFALERLGNPQTEPSGDPLKQLGVVKDLLGVDSLGDLFALVGKGGGRDDWKTDLVKLGAGLLGTLPNLIQGMVQMRAQTFQQQLTLAQLRRQQTGRLPLEAPPLGATHAAPVTPIGQPTPGGEMFQPNPFMNAMDDIVVFFEEGDEGEGAARFIFRKYEEIVSSPMIKPYLAEADKLMELARQTPPLNTIAEDPEFPAFLKNFVDGLNQCFAEAQSESGPDAQPPATPTPA